MKDNEGKPSEVSLRIFRDVLSSHDNVIKFTEKNDQTFTVERKKESQSEVCVFFVDSYTLGVADCIDILKMDSNINCIVLATKWNKYTEDAKNHMRMQKKGLFDIAEFMGALHRDDFWNYFKKNNKK